MSKIIKSNYVIVQNPKEINHYSNVIKPLNDINENALYIIDEAYAEKETILNDALKEAKSIIDSADEYKMKSKTVIVNQLEAQKEKGYKIGYDEGYKKGLSLGKTEGEILATDEINKKNEDLVAKLCTQICLVEESKDEILKNFEKDLIKLSVNIAEKIIKTKILEDEDIIKNILLNAVKDYKNVEWIKIYLSSDDYVTISTDKNIIEKLSLVSERVMLEVITEADNGALIIETPENLIDAGVNTQLKNVKEMFYGA